MPDQFGSGVAAAELQQSNQKTKSAEAKSKRLVLFLLVSVGIVVITAGVAVVLGFQLAQSRAANKSQFDEGKTAGKSEQEAADKDAAVKADLSNVYTYRGPDELGAFSFTIPKSFAITTTKTGKDNLILLAHPDVVNQQDKNLAFRFTVRDELFTKVRESYDKDAKERRNGMKDPEEIEIDSRKAVRYVGNFDRRDKPGTLILVNVRDKTFIYQTDDNSQATLLQAFQEIVGSSRIP